MTRSELYHLIWKEPLSKVAPILGVSKPTLLKACRAHQIPVPGRGYWTRVKAGQSTPPIGLPEGEDVEVALASVNPVAQPQQVLGGSREISRQKLDVPIQSATSSGIDLLLELGLKDRQAKATYAYLVNLLLLAEEMGAASSTVVKTWVLHRLDQQ